MSYFKHDYSNFNKERFLADFNNLNFDYLNDGQTDVDTKFNRFLATLENIIKSHVWIKKLSKRCKIKKQALGKQ